MYIILCEFKKNKLLDKDVVYTFVVVVWRLIVSDSS